MNPSKRMVKEHLRKINWNKFREVFEPWKPEEFGRVDRMAEFYGIQSRPFKTKKVEKTK